MAAVRWFLDWVAPFVLIAVGIVWFLAWAEVLGDKPEQGTLVFKDPWWFTLPVRDTRAGRCIALADDHPQIAARRVGSPSNLSQEAASRDHSNRES
jgi:hypothetical protein